MMKALGMALGAAGSASLRCASLVTVLVALATSVHAMGVRAGSSSLIAQPDYTDTFTGTDDGGIAGRPYVAAPLPEYRIESNYGNPETHYVQQPGSAFSIASDRGPGFVQGGAPAYPTTLAPNASGAGSDTGFTQTGGNNLGYGVRYGLRDEYVVQVDMVQVTDRVDITSGDVPGGGFIFAGRSISVFFRGDGGGGVSVFNGGLDTPVPGANTGIAAWNAGQSRWYNYAVRFDIPDNEIEIYVNEVSVAVVDLDTFAGGVYAAGFSNQFVSVSTNTGDRTWTDNFQVGGLVAPCLYSDDFDRADGAPVAGWTEFTNLWRIESNRLVVGPTPTTGPGGEAWAWLGNPASVLPSNVTIEFEIEWLAPGTNGTVGRHGGCSFFGAVPTHRGDPLRRGYTIDWIDRIDDRGIRLIRLDPGGQPLLVGGQLGAATPNPPRRWKIEVAGPNIRFYGDGVLIFDVVDNTYRGGLFGFWQWAGGEHAAYDNLCITEPATILVPCCEISEPAVDACPVVFDGTCSLSIGGGDIVRYTWDFGDGSPTADGAVVEHTYAFADTYTVTLEIENEFGETAMSEKEILVSEVVVDYADDFQRADGAVSGWTVGQGPTWRLEGGVLRAGPSGGGGAGEHWIWAGEQPLYATPEVVFEYDYRFLAPGTVPVVGRHGGFQFHANRATVRTGVDPFSGYFCDWIDRAEDRGIRLTRVDNGAFNLLAPGQGVAAPAQPPVRYRVVVRGPRIQIFGDDVLYVDVMDNTYRGGHFGFWTWESGQEVAIDNLVVTGEPLAPCCEVSDAAPLTGTEVTFDATCSKSFAGAVVSYEWDLGDGTMLEGAVVEHTYTIADAYTVTLVITDDQGNTVETSKLVNVLENLLPFRDCFDRALGPVDGWTPAASQWNIIDGGRLEVNTIATGGEGFLYAGAPPGGVQGDFIAEVDWKYIAATHPDVGRHGAVHFFWNIPTTNRFAADSSGYSLFYIDRLSDRGFTLARWDGAALVVLNPPGGTPAVTEPPTTVRIEVAGDNIRCYADGVLMIDVMDGTYRKGLFALWSWLTNHIVFDNVRIWSGAEPEPCDETPALAGDCNLDGRRDVVDIICYIKLLFPGFILEPDDLVRLPCPGGFGGDANLSILELNGDLVINVSEVIYLSNFLFRSGPPPAQGAGCFEVPSVCGCAGTLGCP